MENTPLKHQLLVAMPQMADPDFEHSVTYIVEHSSEGAMGLTLNRPVQISLGDILSDMDIEIEVPPSSGIAWWPVGRSSRKPALCCTVPPPAGTPALSSVMA